MTAFSQPKIISFEPCYFQQKYIPEILRTPSILFCKMKETKQYFFGFWTNEMQAFHHHPNFFIKIKPLILNVLPNLCCKTKQVIFLNSVYTKWDFRNHTQNNTLFSLIKIINLFGQTITIQICSRYVELCMLFERKLFHNKLQHFSVLCMDKFLESTSLNFRQRKSKSQFVSKVLNMQLTIKLFAKSNTSSGFSLHIL